MIAIKDFEMPKSCFSCLLHNYHFCDAKGIRIEEWWDNGQRAKDCPLVEVKVVEDGNDD